MSKKHFIALADAIREHNATFTDNPFDYGHINALADFCHAQNSQFNRERWLNYIAGNCGKNGGKVKRAA